MSAGTVVLVDDEEDVRRATSQKLELENFKVECYARADRALERIGATIMDAPKWRIFDTSDGRQ